MNDKEAIGIIIRATRLKKKLTQEDICRNNINRKTLYRIENGLYGKNSTYELILNTIGLAGTEPYDKVKIDKLIKDTYNAVLCLDYELATTFLKKIIAINCDNCILECIKNISNILIYSYLSFEAIEEDVNYLLSILPIFSDELQILVLNYIFFKDRKFKTYNLEFCNTYLKNSTNPILQYDYIQYLIKYKQPLLALEICCKQIELLQNSNLYARVVRLYQTRYQLYRNLQPKHSYSAKNDMLNYVNAHEVDLPSETLGDLYYSLGVHSILDQNYLQAMDYFQKSDFFSSPSLTSAICVNFCNLINNIIEFKEYTIPQNEYYPHVRFYKYLYTKYEMLKNNNFDKSNLILLINDILKNNDEEVKSGIVYNLMNIELKQLTKKYHK